eukprot:TRINITY_DN55886_c0_g1_i1.p3 TRINITY_DN55886_c0_g1~~TRINITY_DN55886_c0_g1_i1.p3  ORF type:complete len:112 (+),score=26.45 TRINITY_DN55886_c0_g1_i1:352-687(+)
MPAMAEGLAGGGTAEMTKRPQYCTLPTAYNFCATAPCLKRFLAARESDPVTEAAAVALFDAKVLHWPGSLRKPWQRCLPAARSALDELWWQAFRKACAEGPSAAPCHITCR